ncbi:MAG: FAD binding domain-containing protein [Pseudomonadota bacterium]|nr:FAD binding domain-containing protein [Pseudomonadota bacterium]
MSMAASPMGPEYRAAGTDLSERRRSGVSRGPLREVAAPIGVERELDGGLRLGALTTIAALAADPAIRAGYPGLAAAAAGLATPQIRRMATLGGNIAQRNRCWYFRNPDLACLKKGGDVCRAREGNALYAVAFDSAPCVAPHPSTLAAALIAYDARLDTDRRRGMTIAQALGDGRSLTAETALEPGELITAVTLPAPMSGERAQYKRAIARAHAEWPLVELVVRASFDAGAFARLTLVAGGVAPIPLRLAGAEAAALGRPASEATFAAAGAASIAGANPLPQSRYKLDLLQGLVRDLLEAVAAQG